MTLKKVLIANRGEIACRVIRGCQELEIPTVAVCSDADLDSPHVKLADEHIVLGPPTPSESYLNIGKIIAAAKKSKSSAIHPGYGFLSENADFAQAVEDEGLIFIGPTSDTIRSMGDKAAAKAAMQKAGVPTIPGFSGLIGDEAEDIAADIGYPVLVKAVAGGGGKGMRVVHDSSELETAISAARNEAQSSFGDDRLILEKYLENPKHIEVQIFSDNHGNNVHMFERECSIQRRHQKIIEESPSPAIDDKMRKKMGKAAVDAAKVANYRNAGTVEFLYQSGKFYFLEMNTRLQVEHGVTEMVTGIDLVKLQLKTAAGEKLPFTQSDIALRGSSIQCRIYAEDPSNGFIPSPGKLLKFITPEGPNIRNDIGVSEGQTISSYYDPLIAKLLVWDLNRKDAAKKMSWALKRYVSLGFTTNIPFLQDVINSKPFVKGDLHTGFIDAYFSDWNLGKIPLEVFTVAALSEGRNYSSQRKESADPYSPWTNKGTWGGGF
tara:strand:- start:26114 stop:27589 length:1476 start_codon:yes stop_codon:yes gene_type:complete